MNDIFSCQVEKKLLVYNSVLGKNESSVTENCKKSTWADCVKLQLWIFNTNTITVSSSNWVNHVFVKLKMLQYVSLKQLKSALCNKLWPVFCYLDAAHAISV